MTFRRILVALAAAVLTIEAATARAEPPKKKPAPPRKVLRVEELKVEGRIQKPQAMFLMPRANLGNADLDRSEPLLPKVTRAAEREPF